MEPARSKGHADADEVHQEPPTTFQACTGFLYRRMVEVCLLTASVCGTIVAVTGSASSSFVPIFIPFWPIVLAVVALQVLIKFKSFVLALLPCTSHDLGSRSSEWLDHLRASWWEIAYVSHVVAFSLMVFFAFLIRKEVFWPTLFTWGFYFLERAYSFKQAGDNRTPILIGEGKSSYNVNAGTNSDPVPSHVRLVVKKPPGFEYRAGQWAYLSVSTCGTHLGAPGWMAPLQHWHAFSIASAEHEDEMEFHIAVSQGGKTLVGDGDAVTASGGDESSFKLSRKGHWIDWMWPHRVPFFGPRPQTDTCGTHYNTKTSGISVNLSGTDGTQVKTLQPQLQWTGRLWNLLQWMMHLHGEKGQAPEMFCRVTGPYGTMPFTCDAHQAIMLIGAGVGFPSTGALLRRLLYDNVNKSPEERKSVCFMWTASKVDQLLLCFPSLLVDLTRYVNQKSLEDLTSWLTIKIFISSFDAGDFLNIDPAKRLFPESESMAGDLAKVREWLLGKDGEEADDDGTYIAQGSLGASFGDILRCSHFSRKLLEKKQSLGMCFCGPAELCSWIRHETASTRFPVKVEFNSESTSG